MAVISFLRRLLRFMSEPFYYYQWTGWKVIEIAAPALLLLSLIILWRRKEKANRIYAGEGRVREHLHVIGANLVERKQSHKKIGDTTKDFLANRLGKAGKRQNWKETTGRFEKLNREIDQLQHEIAKHEQTEAQLDQKVAELTPAHERLQNELFESKQIEDQFIQRVARLTADNEELQQKLLDWEQGDAQLTQEIAKLTDRNDRLQKEIGETRDAEAYLKQQLTESQAANDQLESRVAENEQAQEALKLTAQLAAAQAPSRIDAMLANSQDLVARSSQSDEPLDVSTLQAIAALLKQIQGRSRQN